MLEWIGGMATTTTTTTTENHLPSRAVSDLQFPPSYQSLQFLRALDDYMGHRAAPWGCRDLVGHPAGGGAGGNFPQGCQHSSCSLPPIAGGTQKAPGRVLSLTVVS